MSQDQLDAQQGLTLFQMETVYLDLVPQKIDFTSVPGTGESGGCCSNFRTATPSKHDECSQHKYYFSVKSI